MNAEYRIRMATPEDATIIALLLRGQVPQHHIVIALSGRIGKEIVL